MALIDKDQLKKFKEALEAIIVSSQGLTYDACKDVAEKEATFLISILLQEPNIQSSNIKEIIRKEIERRREYGKFQYDHIAVGLTPAHYFKGVVDTLEEVLDFLDTLPEQPEPKSVNIPYAGGGMSTTPPSYKSDIKKDWHEENASHGAFALTQNEIDFYYKKVQPMEYLADSGKKLEQPWKSKTDKVKK